MGMKKRIKKILLGIFLCLIIVFAVYEAVCIIATHDVVSEVETVIKGEKVITDMDSPFYPFGKNCYDDVAEIEGKVQRFFTYCGESKGRIYILYWKIYKNSSEEIICNSRGANMILYIEKVNGEWVLTGSYEHP